MLIDCETCVAPEGACGDCVVAVLLRRPADGTRDTPDLDAQECAALDSLADAGLVPPLRLVPLLAGQPRGPAHAAARRRGRRPA